MVARNARAFQSSTKVIAASRPCSLRVARAVLSKGGLRGQPVKPDKDTTVKIVAQDLCNEIELFCLQIASLLLALKQLRPVVPPNKLLPAVVELAQLIAVVELGLHGVPAALLLAL